VGFIFTIHFFNTHFRPEKFPMDMVVFTGKIPLSVFMTERPREYEQLVAENKLKKLIEGPPPKLLVTCARIFGFTALSIGVFLIVLIVLAMLY
jgi:hypothetical protein